jgi:glycosyltransferase involved in cell wall biosynthesis
VRVVFTIPGWYLGGFVTFCRNLSAGLRHRGHDVILLAQTDSPSSFRGAVDGLFDSSITIPRGFSRIGPYVRKVAQEVDRLKPDVLVLNDSPYVMAALPYIQRPILRTPVIHSVEPSEIELGLSTSEWWDHAIAVSEFVAQAVRAKGPAARVSVCGLGVPVPATTRQQLRELPPRPVRLISIGRIVVGLKRMDRLPSIAAHLAERAVDYRWTVLGDGDYLPELRRELNAWDCRTVSA